MQVQENFLLLLIVIFIFIFQIISEKHQHFTYVNSYGLCFQSWIKLFAGKNIILLYISSCVSHMINQLVISQVIICHHKIT